MPRAIDVAGLTGSGGDGYDPDDGPPRPVICPRHPASAFHHFEVQTRRTTQRVLSG